MAYPDSIILLIVDYHAAIGRGQDPVPPCVRPWHEIGRKPQPVDCESDFLSITASRHVTIERKLVLNWFLVSCKQISRHENELCYRDGIVVL